MNLVNEFNENEGRYEIIAGYRKTEKIKFQKLYSKLEILIKLRTIQKSMIIVA